MPEEPKIRYRLVRDESFHYLLIPADKESVWYEWMESEAATYGDYPDWVIQVNGDASRVTFTDYKIELNDFSDS